MHISPAAAYCHCCGGTACLQVRYDSSEADMQQVAALYAAQLHIDGGHVRDLLHVVAATEERRRL